MIQICKWQACQKNCPKANLWKALAEINKELHSFDKRRILIISLNWLNKTLELIGCAAKIFENKEEPNLITVGSFEKNNLNSLPEFNIKEALKKAPLTMNLGSLIITVFPIVYKTKIFGVIYTCSQRKFENEELHMIKSLVEHVSIALENERKYQIAMKNWYEAVEELWSRMNVWEICEETKEKRLF